jgi:phosphoglucosamine mutase
VVISASHNPHADNGFKFFGPDGGKLSDDVETQIESLLDTPMQCVSPEQFGRVKRIDDAAGRYIEFCKSTFASRNLRGLRLVVDCANGAAYKVAPAVFEELDADVVVIASEPDGLNINAGCGSTHLGLLQQAVKKHGADVGIALDGDADRCLMVDAAGQAVDGDQILYVLARAAHEAGRLQGPVVGTLMSNLGLEQALQRLGLSLERVSVGDRYVLERLRQVGGTLGGEGSGHTICLDKTSTGDGIVTALQVLASMEQKGASLAALLEGMHLFPQTLVNVPVKGKASALLESAEIRQAVAEVERRLGSSGRVLLRASGTEPLVRVMVECDSAESARREANALADMVKGLIKS